MAQRLWTREEEIIVFNLYCKIPFKNSSKNHPDVIRIANLIGRSPSAVNMKIGNFGSFDENLKKQGIVGLTNASKLDKDIFEEFSENWDKLAYESELLISKLNNSNVGIIDENIPEGSEHITTVKARVNQNFFRNAVLSSYNSTCCITGICTPKLLIASHIKPWKNSTPTEKTDPRNGICLNALHDKAFDQGYITIQKDYTITISQHLKDIYSGSIIEQYFGMYNGKQIIMPEKFIPNRKYLEYHNDVIFQR
ncbi:MAG: HNH endonuclease [Ruminococcaceae bacterium]|nr:HNH endonuclease [Oscillospiraceae bacterium]